MKMPIIISILFLWLIPLCLLAKSPLLQIDMVLFTLSNTTQIEQSELSLNKPNQAKTISFTAAKNNSYKLLLPKDSPLEKIYWTLNHRPEYKALGIYSWIQPAHNQFWITLPNMQKSGWKVQGSVLIDQHTFHELNTNLVFTSQENPKTSFLLRHKHRLKSNLIYYLDHPQAGMIIKITKLS